MAERGKETIAYAIDSNERYEITLEKRKLYVNRIHRAIIAELSKKYGDNMFWSDPIFYSDYTELITKVNYGLIDTDILGKFIEGKVTADEIVKMTPDEMDPDANQQIKDMIDLRLSVQIKLKTHNLYICPKCGKRETTSEDRQTRCADEAPTTLLTCVHCKHVWRSTH